MHRAADSFIVFIREMKFCHFIELHPLGRSKVAPVAESSKDDYALFPFAYIGILNWAWSVNRQKVIYLIETATNRCDILSRTLDRIMNRDYATSGYLWPGYLGEGIYSSGLTISQELARVSIRYYTELHSRIRMEQPKITVGHIVMFSILLSGIR